MQVCGCGKTLLKFVVHKARGYFMVLVFFTECINEMAFCRADGEPEWKPSPPNRKSDFLWTPFSGCYFCWIFLFHITIAAAVRLSYEHSFRKIAWFRRPTARPPYEIIKPYSSHIVADLFLDMTTFAGKFTPILDCKTTARQTHDDFVKMTRGWTCQLSYN